MLHCIEFSVIVWRTVKYKTSGDNSIIIVVEEY